MHSEGLKHVCFSPCPFARCKSAKLLVDLRGTSAPLTPVCRSGHMVLAVRFGRSRNRRLHSGLLR